MYVRTCMYPIGSTSVLYVAHAARMLHQPVPLFTRCPLTQPHTYIPTRIHTNTHTPAYTHTYTHSYTPTYIHTPSHLHTYTQHTPTPTHTITSTLSHTLVHILRPPDLSKDPDPFPDVTGDIIFVWKHLCQHDKAYVLPCGTFQEFYEALQMSSSMANSTLLARGGQSTMTHTLLFPCVLEFSGPAGGVGWGQLPYTFLMVCPSGIQTGVWD